MAASHLMLLRREQLAALGASVREAFADRLRRHVGELFPRRVAALGPVVVESWIEAALARATERGIRSERACSLWVDLWFALGGEPGQGTGQQWIEEFLAGEGSDSLRLQRIYAAIDARCPWAGDLPEETHL